MKQTIYCEIFRNEIFRNHENWFIAGYSPVTSTPSDTRNRFH